ncbi:DHA2 family efflux MFS transporter permease subunit [Ancylobacter sp. A5.8]|uniref:DHA2 family efflux MFS transporter permease subunit n=1 Tax=Ancylobacter gelatini TaxID=2919920 RepID=UPI001F4EA9BE|nr:DHA2 family efflux MFS transporter permease subunit [Ancylobacter gelatini]
MFREPEPLPAIANRPSYVWIVVGTVCIGAFMGQLDASITQLVLPALEASFDSSVDVVSWVAVVYLVTAAATLPLFGRLADLYGRKLLYTFGFLVFVLGSGLCGFATSLEALIAARALQSIGSAMLTANSVAIVVSIASHSNRGKALGIQAAMQAVGLCAGPTLGGLILSALDWRWVFWVNVPVGLIGAAISWFVLPVTTLPERRGRFDGFGAVLLVPGLGALMLAVNQAGSWGPASPAILASAGAAVLLLGLFVWHEGRTREPLVSLALFRRPAFSLGNAASLLANAILFALFFLMPFAYQRVFHQDVLAAGLYLTAIPIALALLAPLSGALSDRMGYRALCTAGMLVAAAGLMLLHSLLASPEASVAMITLALALIGVGQGLFFAPNNNAIMGSATSDETGEAGGVMNVTRNIGTSLGIAVAAALLSWQLRAGGSPVASTHLAPPAELLSAIRLVVAVLAGGALAAALASFVRPAPRGTDTRK